MPVTEEHGLSPLAFEARRVLQLEEASWEWFARMARLDVGAGGARLPEPGPARDLLRRLGVVAPDADEIVASMPTPRENPEASWLLERSVAAVVGAIGQLEGGGVGPSLPLAAGHDLRFFWVHVLMACVPHILAWHETRGIPEEVSWATLADLGRQVRRYRRTHGVGGFDEQAWLSLHFTGALYALGRLQFNPYAVTSAPDWWPEPTPAMALGVHIPESGPMTPTAVDDSLHQARGFFARHLPDRQARIATCGSWLMDPQLADYLPGTSNIVSFQRRFNVVEGAWQADAGVIYFVFGRIGAELDDLPQETSLQRAIVGHIRDGGHWYARTGWLEL